MNELMLPIMIVVLASVFQGTFGIGMKYVKPLSWEAWWVVQSLVAMLLFPLIWALIVTPDLFTVISKASMTEVAAGATMGFLWGIGGIMFGISVGYIGMSLTYGIVMGGCGIAATIIALIQGADTIVPASIPFTILGLVLYALALVVVTIAGLKRDKILAEAGQELQGIAKGAALRKGLIIAVVCGLLSSLLFIGFNNTGGIGEIAQEHGASVRNSALARWVVVLMGALVMNLGYALILLAKNKTVIAEKTGGVGKAIMWAVITGLLWFAALGTMGQGSAMMGDIGAIIATPIFLALSLIVSNVAAMITGEWKGAGKALNLVFVGVALIVLAAGALSYAGTFKADDSVVVVVELPDAPALTE
ncbi:L-rhamnose/proton symporter RhaT [Pontiella sulfatireligans]|uniref:L-rhamnose-proton symporter n=1 Tax=Pontiella sulfatireligans TaxID=2750658 RepID=A0A6C2UN75_9BACT|nr:L-rhamnose/proton symporter RhaT [Pontiella sulfatireligans]VGO21730.1 L-rhamnose-proton symporter [Pontiella sulfatireligans]